MFGFLQRIGKAFMLPIAILPAAGLLLGIGGAFSNANTIAAYPILDNEVLQGIFIVMSKSGDVIFANLPLIMAIGLAVGLAKAEKGVAALSAAVAFLVMKAAISGYIIAFGSDLEQIDTGMVGAIVIGSLVVFLHNRYRNIELPQVLGFFGGSRFIPIISSICAIFVALVFFIVWPIFNQMLISFGGTISKLGPIGTFLYGFVLRITGAIGLHHAIYPLFWYTPIGGTEVINNVSVVGAQNIFFAQLADPEHTGLFTEGTRFFAGRFLTMMFGLPGAAYAMYRAIPKKRRKLFAGMFISVAFTSFLTGITEPLEFMFLFVSPILYLIHALLDGLSFMVADILNINIGNTFSGGIIDFTLFGVLQGNDKTNWILVIPLGFLWFGMYYFIFTVMIKKFNIKTPGMSGEEITELSTKQISEKLIQAFGGAENISSLESCITRVRATLVDKTMIDKDLIDTLGSSGYIDVDNGIQVIYGAKAQVIVKEMNKVLGEDE